jgi:hypothetical protein
MSDDCTFEGRIALDDVDVSVGVVDFRVRVNVRTREGRRKPVAFTLDPADADRLRLLIRAAADAAESERSEWV